MLEEEAQGPLETALEASETIHTQESDGDASKALETMKESPEELKGTLCLFDCRFFLLLELTAVEELLRAQLRSPITNSCLTILDAGMKKYVS